MKDAKELPMSVGVPGTSISVSVTGAAVGVKHQTLASGTMAFDSAKHLLSDKPLRAPNRTRPIDDRK